MRAFLACLRHLTWACITVSLLAACSVKQAIKSPTITPLIQSSTTMPPSPTPQHTASPTILQVLPTPSQIALLGQGEVKEIVLSPDGRTFAVAGSLGIHLYDVKTRKEINRIPFPSPFSLQYSPNGRFLAVTANRTRQLIDLATGQIVLGKESDPQIFGETIFSPDSTTLVVMGYYNEGVDIYELKTFTRTHELPERDGQDRTYSDAKISPDSRWLAVVDSAADHIILWDLQEGLEHRRISNHTGLPWTVDFSPDGQVLVSAGEDSIIRFWSVPNGQLIRTITGLRGGIYRIQYIDDGKHLRIEYGNDYPVLLSVQTGQKIQEIHEDYVDLATDPAYDFLGLDGFQWGDPAFTPDGKLVMVGYNKAVIWDLAEQRPSKVIRIENLPYYVKNYGFSPAGAPLALEKGLTQARRLSHRTESILEDFEDFDLQAVTISPDGKALAIGRREAVELWDIAARSRLWKLSVPLEAVTSLYFSSSGDTITAISETRTKIYLQNRAHLIDTRTGEDLNQLDLFPASPSSHSIAVNGRWIAVVLDDGQVDPPIWVMDMVSGKILPTFEGLDQLEIHYNSVLHFSPDARLIALLSYNRISIWNTASGELVFNQPLKGDESNVSEETWFQKLAFSPDGSTLSVSYQNHQMAVWDIRSISQASPPLNDKVIQSLPPAPIPTPTPVLPPDVLRYQCLEITPDTSSWSLPSDRLLLDVDFDYKNPVLLNLNDREYQELQTRLDQEMVVDGTTSPDGRWLVLDIFDSETRGSRLEVRPADLMTGRAYSYPLNNQRLVGWLDNRQISLRSWGRIFAATTILDPFSGKQASFYLEDMPDYPMTMDASGYYFSRSNIMPDPSLNLVVFPQFEWNGEERGNRIVLWDRRSNTALAKVEDGHFDHDPLWSIDGQDFVIAAMVFKDDMSASTEWFQVTREGEVHQISHYRDGLNATYIQYSARSADGSKVAFELNGQLAVLDVQSQQTISYCLPGPEWPGPIWSPDGRYLVYSFTYTANGSKVVLIDTVENKAAYLLDDASPTGWLNGE